MFCVSCHGTGGKGWWYSRSLVSPHRGFLIDGCDGGRVLHLQESLLPRGDGDQECVDVEIALRGLASGKGQSSRAILIHISHLGWDHFLGVDRSRNSPSLPGFPGPRSFSWFQSREVPSYNARNLSIAGFSPRRNTRLRHHAQNHLARTSSPVRDLKRHPEMFHTTSRKRRKELIKSKFVQVFMPARTQSRNAQASTSIYLKA